MTAVITTVDQQLTTTTPAADPTLTVLLLPGIYQITAQILWFEPSPAAGGLAIGFTCSPAPTLFDWSSSGSTIAFGNNNTVPYTGTSGESILLLTGTLNVAVSTTLSLLRAQGVASGTPTTLSTGSWLNVALIGAAPTPIPVAPGPINASVTCPEDVVNIALARIGFDGRVANMLEGSKQANLALDIYAHTRDELLRQSDWGFAERNVTMVLLKSAPATGYVPPITWDVTYPAPPWLFEYAYPADCLKVRAVKPVPVFVPNFDPQPYLFSVANDNGYSPPAKVIMCNVPTGLLVYTGQIQDPLTWEDNFIEAFVLALARRLAPLLKPPPVPVTAQEEDMQKLVAEGEVG